MFDISLEKSVTANFYYVKKGETTPFFNFLRKGNKRINEKNKDFHESKIQDSRSLGGTSRVVLELKPFGILIRGPIVSEPWVGRNTGKMSGNSRLYIALLIVVVPEET